MVIVPSVDVRAGHVAYRSGTLADTSPEEFARRHVTGGATELHLVDLNGAENGDYVNALQLARIARECGVPCRLAGGISSIHKAEEAAAQGFAGVLFSSAVFGDDALLERIGALGAQAIVEIEASRGFLEPRGGDAELVEHARGRGVLAAAASAIRAGVRQLYVIDVSTEGRFGGPALELLESLRSGLGSRAEGVAFHTGGGIRDLGDITALGRWGVATAVVGRALAERRFTLAEAVAAAAQ